MCQPSPTACIFFLFYFAPPFLAWDCQQWAAACADSGFIVFTCRTAPSSFVPAACRASDSSFSEGLASSPGPAGCIFSNPIVSRLRSPTPSILHICIPCAERHHVTIPYTPSLLPSRSISLCCSRSVCQGHSSS